MIKNDKPQNAPPPSQEEKKKILDTLAKHITSNSVLILEGEERRGQKSIKKDNQKE